MDVLDDPRIGFLLERNVYSDGVGLVFFPCDEGVRRNGGRPGSSFGPQSFLKLVQRTGTLVNAELGFDISKVPVGIVGDAEPLPAGSNLEEQHELLEKRVRKVLDAGAVPFVIGGGNDQSYPNARAWLARAGAGRLACINIDAHLDVRPLKEGKAHSGSPFRLLIEDPRFGGGGDFIEFAAQGSQCSAVHAAWLAEKGSHIMWLSYVKAKGALSAFEEAVSGFGDDASLFISFDLDAVVGSDAPGVSAPGVAGLSAAEALQICFAAGSNPRVKLFDLSEYNPLAEPGCAADGIIPGYRTGKLVAAMFYHFLLGFSTRTIK
jgi:formiminoglutamase